MHDVRSPRQTLLLVLIPMLTTFIGQRFYLHLIPIKHLVLAGFLIHHLFLCLLIALPAAFVLAFGFRNRLLATAAPLLLGVGTAMVDVFCRIMERLEPGRGRAPAWWLLLVAAIGGELFYAFKLFDFSCIPQVAGRLFGQ